MKVVISLNYNEWKNVAVTENVEKWEKKINITYAHMQDYYKQLWRVEKCEE